MSEVLITGLVAVKAPKSNIVCDILNENESFVAVIVYGGGIFGGINEVGRGALGPTGGGVVGSGKAVLISSYSIE